MVLCCFSGNKLGKQPLRRKVGSSKKLCKRQWSDAEKAAVKETMKKYIAQRKPLPGKTAIETAKKNAPILQNRSWRNIKDCVRNIITANDAKMRRKMSQ